MSTPRPGAAARALSGWLLAGICVAVTVLAWFGVTTSLEWRHSSEQLLTRRAEAMADLLVRALARDMRGVHDQVLRGLQREQVTLDHTDDLTDIVATAFARYPYPECFFVWSDDTPADEAMFFSRADRLPAWQTPSDAESAFPVAIARSPGAARLLVERAAAEAGRGREFAVFETTMGGDPYQVVARLMYGSTRRVRLELVVGFVVNLRWARSSYFRELAAEVQHVSGTYDGLDVEVEDEAGVMVAGVPIPHDTMLATARTIRPLFFDPALVAVDPPDDLPLREWTVRVSAADDPSHASAVAGANRTLVATTSAAFAFGVGLLLTRRALRDSARLAELRADFVSSVTHELKTPLATIIVAAETLARGHVLDRDSVRDYAQIVGQESKRLTRLVDNLLAYARVTDVGEVYTVEPLAVADVVDDIVRRFRPQFLHQGVEAQIDIPADLPAVAADRTALDLVFDNVLDNAFRYATGSRRIAVTAGRAGTLVEIAVRDDGPGMPPEELTRVQQRFVRGRHVAQAGSGLGLAIASRIVGDLGGSFGIESTVGEGTTVRLRLPVSDMDTEVEP